MSTVAKVFRILEEIVFHQEKGLSYSEVVEKTGLPKASAHRLLKSLVEMGYVRFDAEAGRYFGDLKLSFLDKDRGIAREIRAVTRGAGEITRCLRGGGRAAGCAICSRPRARRGAPPLAPRGRPAPNGRAA